MQNVFIINSLIFFNIFIICKSDIFYDTSSNNYPKTEVLLLGFDCYQYDSETKRTGFYVTFVPLRERIYPNKASITLVIQYRYKKKTRIFQRNLNEEVEEIAQCNKMMPDDKNYQRFWCSFKPRTYIDSIVVYVNQFQIPGQMMSIKAMSPIATKYLDNLRGCPKKPIFDRPVYILNKAKREVNDTAFNITGKMRPKDFYYDEVNLMISSIDKLTERTVTCEVIPVKKKFTLSCNPKKGINGDLDGVYANLEGENLIVNFDEDEDSYLELKYKSNPSSSSQKSEPEIIEEPNRVSKITVIIIMTSLIFAFIFALSYYTKTLGGTHQIIEGGNMDVVKFSNN